MMTREYCCILGSLPRLQTKREYSLLDRGRGGDEDIEVEVEGCIEEGFEEDIEEVIDENIEWLFEEDIQEDFEEYFRKNVEIFAEEDILEHIE